MPSRVASRDPAAPEPLAPEPFPVGRNTTETDLIYASLVRVILLFIVAGFFEIGGGYLVWVWLREGRGIALGLAGFLVLALYGIIPVFQPREHPFGRVYAAYGAVFIILSTLWGWAIDRQPPDARDWIGCVICIAGAAVMMWPRAIAAASAFPAH